MTSTGQMTKRVLAIDDDETILGVIDNVLSMHDYEAVTATQWVEALDAINQQTPDLLLLDLQMPHVDGFFLLEWVREQEIEMPVIVVSAYLDEDSVTRLESLGVDTFVWKPFNVSDLIANIENLIGQSAPPGDVSPTEAEDIDGTLLDRPSEGLSEDAKPIGRRRVHHRRRRGVKKRRRRRMALYLSVIAVISLGISGLTIYLGSVATSVEKAVEEKITKVGGIGDESELLKELLRAKIEKPPKSPPKALDLDLKRK